jgi:hypothetical protein
MSGKEFDANAFVREHDKLEVLKPSTVAFAVASGVAEEAYKYGLQAAIIRRPNMAEWAPIETAPRDGSSYLVWAGCVGMAHYVENYQSGYAHRGPFSENMKAWKTKATHWMPLPAAPTDSTARTE